MPHASHAHGLSVAKSNNTSHSVIARFAHDNRRRAAPHNRHKKCTSPSKLGRCIFYVYCVACATFALFPLNNDYRPWCSFLYSSFILCVSFDTLFISFIQSASCCTQNVPRREFISFSFAWSNPDIERTWSSTANLQISPWT